MSLVAKGLDVPEVTLVGVVSADIALNGVSMIRAAMHDLMDRMPGPEVVTPIREAALDVPGVGAIEKLHVAKAGMSYRVTVHVQTDGSVTLHEAHVLGGRVKSAICASAIQVSYVLVHMEPYDGAGSQDGEAIRQRA